MNIQTGSWHPPGVSGQQDAPAGCCLAAGSGQLLALRLAVGWPAEMPLAPHAGGVGWLVGEVVYKIHVKRTTKCSLKMTQPISLPFYCFDFFLVKSLFFPCVRRLRRLHSSPAAERRVKRQPLLAGAAPTPDHLAMMTNLPPHPPPCLVLVGLSWLQ